MEKVTYALQHFDCWSSLGEAHISIEVKFPAMLDEHETMEARLQELSLEVLRYMRNNGPTITKAVERLPWWKRLFRRPRVTLLVTRQP